MAGISHSKKPNYVALATLVAGVLFSIGMGKFMYWSDSRDEAIRFDAHVDQVQSRIRGRMESFENFLIQTRGFLQSKKIITREAFHKYSVDIQLENRYPAFQGLAYITRVPSKELGKFVQRVRAEGSADYKVWPIQTEIEHYPITYIEPEDWRNKRGLGFDMFSEPVRRATLEKARDSGLPTLSARVKLVQEAGEEVQPGLLMFLPIYQDGANINTSEERSNALKGFLGIPIRVHDFFRIIFKDQNPQVDFEVYDSYQVGTSSLIYDHDGKQNTNHRETRSIELAGHGFTIAFSPLTEAPRFPLVPTVVTLFGILFSVFLSTIVRSRRLKAEETKRSVQKLTQLADSMNQLAWIAYPNGHIFWYNQRWYDFTGTTFQEMEGGGWKSIHHPDHVDRVVNFVEKAWPQPEPWELTFPLRRHDGQWRWFLTRAVPITDFSGEIVQWFGTNTDITEQRNSEQQVIDVLESMGDAFIALDKNFTVLRVNHHQERIAGLNREQTLGKNHWDIWPKEVIPNLWTAYHKVVKEKVPVHVEEHNSQLNLWLSVSAYPTPDNGLAIFFRDITQQKFLSQALWDSEAQFRDFADSMPQLSWMAHADGFIFWYNKGWYEYTGATAKDMEGWGWQSVHDPEFLPSVLERWQNSIATGKNFEMTFPLKDANGEFRSFLTRVTPVRGYDGKIIRWFGTSTDVTIEIRTQEELLRRTTELESLQSQLIKVAEQANEASRLKSAFLANMSHEIRTPLGAMIGFADLLRDPGLSQNEIAGYVDILTRNGENLAVIINDILDLSKVEAGHLTLEFTQMKPSHIAEEVVSLLRVKAKEKDLIFEYIAEESSPQMIVADPARLRQILINLVGNAIKFTQFGSVKIRSYGCKTKNDRNAICYDISDTGIGIPTSQMEKVFQMFVQADGSMTRRFGGTGLGLALSKSLATEMGGDITIVETQEGVGTTFKVMIEDQPHKKSVVDQVEKGAYKVEMLGDQALRGLHILVVDDSPDNQQLIWRYLTKQGAIVESAENGLLGYRAAITGNFDLVLMDIQMPVMDGYTATQKLRENNYRKPIIALTAHAMSEVRKKALYVGYTDHLTKPINPNELISAIVRYTRKYEPRG